MSGTLYFLKDFQLNGKRYNDILSNLVKRYKKGVSANSAPDAAKKYVTRIYRSSSSLKKPSKKAAVKITMVVESRGRSVYNHNLELTYAMLEEPTMVTRGDQTFEVSTATTVVSHDKTKIKIDDASNSSETPIDSPSVT